jgi:hypothetical protein
MKRTIATILLTVAIALVGIGLVRKSHAQRGGVPAGGMSVGESMSTCAGGGGAAGAAALNAGQSFTCGGVTVGPLEYQRGGVVAS